MTEENALVEFREKFSVESLHISAADGWVLSLRPYQITLGSMLISVGNGERHFSDIREGMGAGFFELVSLAERLSKEVFGAEKVNVIALMMEDPIVHFHIIPRYAKPVQFRDTIWEDSAWPRPPVFSMGTTERDVIDAIHSEIIKFIENTTKKRKLKPWMRDTLKHYERCDSVFYDMFGDHLYAVGGTLLGGVRDGGFISHDKDMDVAYFSDESSRTAVRKQFVSRIVNLLDLGERLTIVDRRGVLQRRHAKWWGKNNSYVDLFPAFYDDQLGTYSRPTFVNISLPKSDIAPLRKIKFEGSYIYVPNNFERKIVSIFGEDWRTPDPTWTKPIFDGRKDMRKEFAFSWSEIKLIAEHSRYQDRVKLQEMIDSRATKVTGQN